MLFKKISNCFSTVVKSSSNFWFFRGSILKITPLIIFCWGFLWLVVDFKVGVNKTGNHLEIIAEPVSQPIASFPPGEEINADYLLIPRIDVRAPVVYNVGLGQEEILAKLQTGVVFYAGSDLPNEEGLAVYFGHSANYWWRQGSDDQVFREISRLNNQDKIYSYYAGQEYVYQVAKKAVINKKDWEQLDNPPVEKGIALITCWPLGTTWKRYVVWAYQTNSD